MILRKSDRVRTALITAALAVIAGPAAAQQPRHWELGLQQAATPQMERISSFHNLLLVIITVITLFVLGLLIYVMYRFNEKRNPEPTKTSHNTLIEIVWTVVPVVILVAIAVPSFNLLYYLDRTDEAELTVKAIGRQWYWSYEYPDSGNFTFDSTMLEDDQRQEGQPRLLAVNNPIVVPVDTNIRLLITASDVLHSWTVPSFGVKLDAVPGRLNETWVRVEKEGIYYGQCSELCGVRHAFMPIEVHAVSKEAYAAWVADAQQRFARADTPERRVASISATDAQ